VSANPTPAEVIAARRRVALLGVVAVLFQAILFGWHHHGLGPASRGSQSVVTVTNAVMPLSPASAEDDCDVCMALHHFSASPVEFVFLPMPIVAALALRLPHLLLAARASERGFHARAPPRVSDHQV
jgi:hypothetical protein